MNGTDTEKKKRRLDVFPAFFKVRDQRVIVVGHGAEAAAKVRLLGETNARIQIVSHEMEPVLQQAIESVGAEHLREAFRPEVLEGAALVFTAREDEALDRAVVEAARAAGVPVNAVDRPDLCDFYTGALSIEPLSPSPSPQPASGQSWRAISGRGSRPCSRVRPAIWRNWRKVSARRSQGLSGMVRRAGGSGRGFLPDRLRPMFIPAGPIWRVSKPNVC